MRTIWKTIPTYPQYMVSCTGEVLSLMTETPLIMKKSLDTKGYYFVNLVRDTGQKAQRIHRLVASAFLGLNLDNPSECACHKDDNPKNNNSTNLFIGTQQDNLKDMRDKNRQSHNRRFSNEEIRIIQIRLINGETGRKLAKEYNVSPSLISAIKNKKRYA